MNNYRDPKNYPDTSMEAWHATLLSRVDALPEPDSLRSRILREEGRAYELLRIAASSGYEVDDDFMDKLDQQLPACGNAFKAILSIAVETPSTVLMMYLEQAITDAELFDRPGRRSAAAGSTNVDLGELACDLSRSHMIRWAVEGADARRLMSAAEGDLRQAGCAVDHVSLREYLDHLENEAVGAWCGISKALHDSFNEVRNAMERTCSTAGEERAASTGDQGEAS